jgi:putative addiction module component (TIGR02574 family)
MPTLESLGIDKLTTQEKYDLIDAIEESIPDQHVYRMSEADHTEIMQRAADAVANSDSLLTLDAVKTHLAARHS